jgi:hypothetical protein
MAGAKSRHYRVAKKEAAVRQTKGVFIPKKQKNHVILMTVLFIVLAFIDGVIIGSSIGGKSKDRR